MPPSPYPSSPIEVQLQHVNSPIQTRSKRRNVVQQRIEQQVPTAIPHATAIEIMASNARAYELEVEAEFQAQLQPILQLYLQRTRRPSPVNSVFDMSSRVQV